jgi:uncharacterized delta-60 repeat protein
MIESLEARQLLSTGDLDPTFGTRGKVVIDQSYYPDIHVTDAALQRDGKIIEVGELDLWGLAVVRLNTDGTIDPTFTPPTKASDRRLAQFLGTAAVEGASVAIQGDGKILVGVEQREGNFYVLRFDASGNLDHTFGKRGVAAVDFGAASASPISRSPPTARSSPSDTRRCRSPTRPTPRSSTMTTTWPSSG